MMPDTPPVAESWVDIIPPEVPAGLGEPTLLIGLVLAFAVLLLAGLLFYLQPRQRARRRLRRLLQLVPSQPGQGRTLCLEVRQCLRQAFARQNLAAVRFAGRDTHEWESYLSRLARHCFGTTPPPVDELERSIRDALVWTAEKVVTES